MRIAFVGTRGVPATYSGFETFVEQLGARLADRGHEVTVYCRRHHHQTRLSGYRGMRLIYVWGIATKHLDTMSHTAVSCIHCLFRHYDVTVMCISGNSPLALIPRLAGSRVILNVDGSDWRRRKWGRVARAYIWASEWLATLIPHVIVTDSGVMKAYYRKRFRVDVPCITYGADVPEPTSTEMLEKLSLRPRGYFLLVGRLVPENCADHLVDAYSLIDTSLKCVVVGDAPYARAYIDRLKAQGRGVIFPGYVFGDGYRELLHNAYATVLCSEVGGTHPVLVESMAAGNCVIVNDTPANLEVIEDAGLSYDGERGAGALAKVLEVAAGDESLVKRLRIRARRRAADHYSWDAVTDAYERLFTLPDVAASAESSVPAR